MTKTYAHTRFLFFFFFFNLYIELIIYLEKTILIVRDNAHIRNEK